MMERELAFQRFKELAAEMWGEATTAQLTFVLAPFEPEGGHLAALKFAGKPRALGACLIRAADMRLYGLVLSGRLLAMEPDQIDKILIHEAAHIGYRGHGTKFYDLVKRHNGAQSEMGLTTGNRVTLERKEGARYRAFMEFATVQEARRWVVRSCTTHPGEYRTKY